MSRKRVPLNQNECTDDFRIGVPFEQNLQVDMRKAIVYASVHHGNTEKIVKSIAEECQVDLIDAVKQSDADLSSYDMIGFASGIYLWWKCEL